MTHVPHPSRRSLLLAAAALPLAGSALAAAGSTSANPDITGAMRLVFSDEFDRASVLEGGPARYRTSFFWGGRTLPSNGEEQFYVDPAYVSKQGDRPGLDPFEIRDGVLSIVARRANDAERGTVEGYRYVSGMLNTYDSFSFRYGFVEARARVPKGKGLWPALWLLRRDQGKLGEIDIFESFGAKTNYLNSTLHWFADGRSQNLKLVRRDAPDLSADFHRFGLLWTPQEVVMYLDGQEMGRAATPPQLNAPMYLLMNLAVGGRWTGNADASTPFPARFDIDYVRIWQRPEDQTAAAR